MDILFIKNWRSQASIGIHTFEKKILQTIIVDLEIPLDTSAIAAHDQIETTIDYDHLTQSINQFLLSKHFNLIETLAHELAEYILLNFNCSKIKLIVVKENALNKHTQIGIMLNRDK